MKSRQKRQVTMLMTIIIFLTIFTNPIAIYGAESNNIIITTPNTVPAANSRNQENHQDPAANPAADNIVPAAQEGGSNEDKGHHAQDLFYNFPIHNPIQNITNNITNNIAPAITLPAQLENIFPEYQPGMGFPELTTMPEEPDDYLPVDDTEETLNAMREQYQQKYNSDCMLFSPGDIYRFKKEGILPSIEALQSVTEMVYRENKSLPSVADSVYGQNTVLPENNSFEVKSAANYNLDVGSLQTYLNNVAGRRAVNHSDQPYLADRYNESEYIDPTTKGTLSLKRIDLSLPGKDGLDLVLGRCYSSNQAQIGTKKVNIVCTYPQKTSPDTKYGYDLVLYTADGSSQVYRPIFETADAAQLAGTYECDPNRNNIWKSYKLIARAMDLNETYASVRFKNYVDTFNYSHNRYDLGAGWSFMFPSIQMKGGDTYYDTDIYQTFYDGQGGVYEINITPTPDDSNLLGYQGNDIIVDLCTTLNKSYNNGQENATYVYIEKGLKDSYFSNDGRLLGIKDRIGNEIKFFYTSRTVYGRQQQYISRIVDTVGRIVDFSYVDNSDMSGEIAVLVSEPGGKTLTLSYVKGSFDYTYSEYIWDSVLRKQIVDENRGFVRKEPTLAKYIDPEGKEIKYTYELEPISFHFNSSLSYSHITPQAANDIICMLTRVEYPHSTTHYTPFSNRKYVGTDYGIYGDWGIQERYECEQYNNQGVISQGSPKNLTQYSYVADYSHKVLGDPNYRYTFSSKTNGVEEIKTFTTGEGQLQQDQTSDGNLTVQVNNRQWDSRFKQKPTEVAIYRWGTTGSTQVLNIHQAYNDWGGLVSYTDGVGADQDTHRQTYAYTDSINKYQPTQTQTLQNAGTTLVQDYQYDQQGRLIRAQNANSEATTYTYSSTGEGKVTESTLPLENNTQAKTIEVCGPQTNNAYPTEIRNYNNTAANGYTRTNISYDMLLGLPESVTNDAGQQTITSYDKLGRVTSVKLPSLGNNSVEQKTTYTQAATSALFDATNQNLLTTEVDTRTIYKDNSGTEKAYNWHKAYYNAYGQLVLDSVFNEAQNTWIPNVQNHYDAFGRLISETDAQGNTYTYAYDGFGNLTDITDPYGNIYRESIYYDQNQKKLTASFYPAGSSSPKQQVKSSYDAWGTLLQNEDLVNSLSETFTIDLAGNTVAYNDPLGYQYSYIYDRLNRLTKLTNPLNEQFNYNYTVLGKIKDVSVPAASGNLITSREYDQLGQLTKKTDPSGFADTVTYNNLGLVNSSADPNGTTFNYTYDAHNRLTSQSGGGIALQYNYTDHPFGPESITLNNGTSVNYTYDSLGRVSSAATTANSRNSIVSYQYDNTNRITAITGPGGQTTGYIYDKTRLSAVQYNSKNINYEYYPDGPIKTITYPALSDGSVLKTNYEYDSLNRLSKLINTKGDTILSQYQYTYDNNNSIKSVTDGNGVTSYIYDSLNRLSQIQRPGGQTITYTYDTRGNRLSSQGDLIPTDTSQVDYTYNSMDQLTTVNRDSQATSYTYDPTGLRSKKTTPAQTIRYIYNTAGNVIAEADNNNLTASYIWGPNQLLVKQNADNQEYYYLYNGHGDVVQIIDQAGNILNNYEYDEWGNILSQTETIPNEFKYSGQIYDNETGMYYLRARYYDPTLGRFISKDSYEGSITNPLSLNLYTYCSNNPINYWDPTGHTQQGDEKLSSAAQKVIAAATKEYLSAAAALAKGDKSAKARMDKAHQNAENARHSEHALSVNGVTIVPGGYGLINSKNSSTTKAPVQTSLVSIGKTTTVSNPLNPLPGIQISSTPTSTTSSGIASFNLVDDWNANSKAFMDTWNDPATAKAGIQTVGTVAIVVPATVGGALGSGAALGYGGDIMLVGSKVYNQGMRYIYMNAVPLTEKTIILIDLFGPDK